MRPFLFKDVVGSFAACQDKTEGASLTVCAGMDFCRKAAAWSTQNLLVRPFCASSLRMAPNRDAVDHMLPIVSSGRSMIDGMKQPQDSVHAQRDFMLDIRERLDRLERVKSKDHSGGQDDIP